VSDPARRARLIGLLEDLGRTDWGQLVVASGRWLRRQLVREGHVCEYPGCSELATEAALDAGSGGVCIAHLSPVDYEVGYDEGEWDFLHAAPPAPARGWAPNMRVGRGLTGPAYLAGYFEGYIGAPRR
jgi:hypothetical protein